MLFVDVLEQLLRAIRTHMKPWMLLVSSFLVCSGMLSITGPSYFGDTPQYLAGAYSLVHYGKLLDVNGNPMVHWAPALSVLYMPVYAWRIALYDWARLLNLCSLAVYLVCTYRIISLLTKDAILSALFVAVHIFWQPLFSLFNAMQTEPLALALLSVALYALIRVIKNFDIQLFWLLIVVSFFSVMLRYAALFTIGSAAVVLLHLLPFPFRKRFILSLLYGFASVSGFIFWSLRNIAVSGNAVERTLYVHTLNASLMLQDLLRLFVAVTATKYFTMGCIVLLTILGAITYQFVLKEKNLLGGQNRIYGMLLWFAVSYVILIEVTQYFFDQVTMITSRLIAPALYALCIAGAPAIYHILRASFRKKAMPIVFGFFGLLFLIESAASFESMTGTIEEYHKQLSGLQVLRSLQLTNFAPLLYSNNDEMLFFVAERFVKHIPHKLDRYHLTPNPQYESEKAAMLKDLNAGAAIVYFGGQLYERYQMPIEDVRALPSIKNVFEGSVNIFKISAR